MAFVWAPRNFPTASRVAWWLCRSREDQSWSIAALSASSTSRRNSGGSVCRACEHACFGFGRRQGRLKPTLQHGIAAVIVSDSDGFEDLGDEDFAVADFTGARGIHQCPDDLFVPLPAPVPAHLAGAGSAAQRQRTRPHVHAEQFGVYLRTLVERG